MALHKQILQLILEHKPRLALGVVFMLLFAVFSVAPAKYMKNIVDGLGHGEIPELQKFILVGVGIVLLFVGKGITFYFQSYLMNSLGLKMIKSLRDRLFTKMIKMPIGLFNKASTGELISRFTTDLNILNEAINIGIAGPFRDFPQVILLLYLLLDRSWQLFLLTLLMLPITSLVIKTFGLQNKKVTTKRLQEFGELTNHLTETIAGIRVVKAFGMEQYEKDRFGKLNQRLYRYFMHSIRIDSYSYPIIELVGGAFVALILTYGGYLVIHDQITGGDFASFLVSFVMLYEPIKRFNGFTLRIQEGAAAARRVFEILNSSWRITEAPGARILPPMQGEIHIRIDQFRYDPEGEPVLQDIDIRLPAGTVTALVGSSGSGKTTLINLLPRFYNLPPEAGQITIDGQDIQKVTLKSLREQISMVTQEVVLFNDTIANNISYGDIRCDKDRIIEAAKAAHAHDFIMQLEHGYEQEIGEKGVTLSGGQRQRISISRALIKDSRILILDEATSALDMESEKEVQAAIENLMKDRTSLVIAHRLSTIQHADVIHVLSQGRIVESGSHAELLAKGGEYKRLHDMQFREG